MSFKPSQNLTDDNEDQEDTSSSGVPPGFPEGTVKGKRHYYRNHYGVLSSTAGVIGKNLYIAKIDPVTGEDRPLSEITTRLDWDEKNQRYLD